MPIRVALAAVAAVALLASPAADAKRSSARRPDVVMIVFDEFPTVSLLDRRGRIDRVRYPGFASLAAHGDWFPNATASVDETGRAMEALLTGSTPPRHHTVSFEDNPRSIFTMLAGRYRFRVSEEVTAMCPVRLCPHEHLRTRSEVLHELAGGRPERYADWLRSIVPGRQPTFYFKHVLLPHVPLRYLPSGRSYAGGAHEQLLGIVQDYRRRWPIVQAYQRHLLQLGFTDLLLRYTLFQLRRQRRYDRSLIVVTADNGESFGRTGDRHVITGRNAADIALTPLLVKRPGQRRGRIVRRHVRTVDVLPSMARVLHLPTPGPTNGRSFYGPSARGIPAGVTMAERSGAYVHLSLKALRRRGRQALAHKLRLFGSGPWEPLAYRIGPYPGLQGKRVKTMRVARSGRVRAKVSQAAQLRHVSLEASFIPSYLTGRIRGARSRRGRDLAVAVNGSIAATCPSFLLHRRGPEVFSVLVPETALREGRNRVAVYAIRKRRRGVTLVPLG